MIARKQLAEQQAAAKAAMAQGMTATHNSQKETPNSLPKINAKRTRQSRSVHWPPTRICLINTGPIEL
jgi:hypothetical protein